MAGAYGDDLYGGGLYSAALELFPPQTVEIELTPGVWTDYSDLLRAFDSKRGRQQELDRVETGTARATLKDSDRTFDPYTNPLIRPMLPIRFGFSTWTQTYWRFTGYVERWPPIRNSPNDSDVNIECVDAFAIFGSDGATLNNVYPVQLGGARINQILDELGWPSGPAFRAIDAGFSILDAVDLTDSGTSALEHFLQVAESEQGNIFIDGTGRVVFHDRRRRNHPPYTTAAAILTNDGGTDGFPFVGLSPSFDVDDIINVAALSIPGDPIPATFRDDASAALPPAGYGPRTLTRDTLLYSIDDAAGGAAYIVNQHSQPALRFDSLTLKLSYVRNDDGLTLYDAALAREIGDRITVRYQPAGGGAPIEIDCHIEGIADTVTRYEYHVSWQLSPASRFQAWVLDDPVLSVLGVTTRLAY